jgi:hypothetical protein
MSTIETTKPTPADIAGAKSEAASNAYINATVAYMRDPSSDNLAHVRNTLRADREAFRGHVRALVDERRAGT